MNEKEPLLPVSVGVSYEGELKVTIPQHFPHRQHAVLQTQCYTLTYFIGAIAFGGLAPTLPTMIERAMAEDSDFAWVLAVMPMGALVGSLLGGCCSDISLIKKHTHMVLAAGQLMLALSLLGMPMCTGISSFYLVFILFGLGEGAVAACLNGFLPRIWHHSRWLSPAQQSLHFCYGVGAVLAPYVVERLDFDSFYWIVGGLNMAPVVVILLVPSPHDIIKPEIPEHTPPKQGEVSPLKPWGVWQKRALFGLCLGMMFVFIGIQVSFSEWIFIYAEDHFMVDENTATNVTSSFWAAMVVFRLIGVAVAFFLKPIAILLINFIAVVTGLSLFLLFTNEAALWIGTILTGASLATMFGAIFTLPPTAGADIFTTKEAGWLVAVSAGGVVVANGLIGLILEWSSYYYIAFMWLILAGAGLGLSTLATLAIYFLSTPSLAGTFLV